MGITKIDEKTLVPLGVIFTLAGAIVFSTMMYFDIQASKEDIASILEKMDGNESLKTEVEIMKEDITFLQTEVSAVDEMENRLIKIETTLDLIYKSLEKKRK